LARSQKIFDGRYWARDGDAINAVPADAGARRRIDDEETRSADVSSGNGPAQPPSGRRRL